MSIKLKYDLTMVSRRPQQYNSVDYFSCMLYAKLLVCKAIQQIYGHMRGMFSSRRNR